MDEEAQQQRNEEPNKSLSAIGRLGRKAAVQAGSREAIAAATVEIWGPIAIAIGIAALFTFLIVGFAGAPAALETDSNISPTPFITNAPSPTISPSQTP